MSDVVYNDLRIQIDGGSLKPGDRLLSELEMAEHFGVSRPIVREALLRLRKDGHVYSRQGSGSYVAAHDAVADNSARSGLLSIADARQLYDYRFVIEGEIASVAATERSEEDLAAMRRQLERMREAIASGETGVHPDLEFHTQIARATANRFFVAALESARQQMDFLIELARSFSSEGSVEHQLRVQREHERIFYAIESGRSEEALESMRLHIGNARARTFGGVHTSTDVAREMTPLTEHEGRRSGMSANRVDTESVRR